ncbi:hypothetical protein PsYK624_167270 [Phanerochaete sordida]|uniref:Uncharacterized protein n=1 Tax=Phanerochaete sordida TaxID=48140 RepID=A0A9P3LM48_9APHY|nr:hypothetical protein PsYK624_167270 [Phanerochaete sordida]
MHPRVRGCRRHGASVQRDPNITGALTRRRVRHPPRRLAPRPPALDRATRLLCPAKRRTATVSEVPGARHEEQGFGTLAPRIPKRPTHPVASVEGVTPKVCAATLRTTRARTSTRTTLLQAYSTPGSSKIPDRRRDTWPQTETRTHLDDQLVI